MAYAVCGLQRRGKARERARRGKTIRVGLGLGCGFKLKDIVDVATVYFLSLELYAALFHRPDNRALRLHTPYPFTISAFSSSQT